MPTGQHTAPDNAVSSHRRRWTRVGRFAQQLLLIVFAALAYFGVRGLTESDLARATRNAARIVEMERTIGIAWEAAIQKVVIDHDWLVTLVNWVYIYGHWPLIAVTLTWLFLRDHDGFIRLRDTLFLSGAIGIIIFLAFPTAPPRLIEMGLIDTVTEESSSYRALQPPGLVNRYAAMPSLHFGWNLIVGLFIMQVSQHRAMKLVGAAIPIGMAFAVVATANHFVLDVVAGAVVALTGLALVTPVRRLGARRRPRTAA